MQLHFAPLQGYADHIYRRLHAEVCGGIDAYYTPFIRLEGGAARPQDMSRLQASTGDGTHLIPQVIFSTLDEFDALTAAVRGAGYREVDLNLGCPYPMQTRKGRGAAVIDNLSLMAAVGERVRADGDMRYSVKMRLGLTRPDEWRALVPLLNDMPLQHVAIHPRIAGQLYGGELYADECEAFVAAMANPVIVNGDLTTIADIEAARRRYPTAAGVMIGRGLLGRPTLAMEWRAGAEMPREERVERVLELHRRLYDEYRATLCGPTQILQKIKPFWDFMEPEFGRRALKAIKKATTLAKYEAAVPQE